MQVTSATTKSAYDTSTDAATLAATPKKTVLGQDDFLKLLAVQFQQQDPMKPMEDTAFIAQMAQFSSLEQSNSLVKEMGLLRSDQQNLAANGMIGRTVTVTDDKGNPVIGQVSAVVSTDKGPALLINGQQFPLSTVTRIENTLPAADLPPAA